MTTKFYAVKYGIDPKTKEEIKDKIFKTWKECSSAVKGVKGAKYKSFKTEKEALQFLELGNKLLNKKDDTYNENIFHAYVDGSYHNDTKAYSYGLVITYKGVIYHLDMKACKNKEEDNNRQVAGELEGAIKAVEFAKDNSINEIAIFHDYVGVAYHATGFWERKETSSVEYYEKINKLMKDNYINVSFVKVDSHTGDLFNEMADELAKYALGIKSTGEIKRYLNNENLKVIDEKQKTNIEKIIGTKLSERIEIVDTNYNKCEKEKKEDLDEIIKIIYNLKKIDSKESVKEYLQGLDREKLHNIILELI
ncbi:hypothetical protein SH2C18_37630 [Clostridium sediminicola]|uniref:ribonuclease H1 domain-containing protein n=1 Tax=Clostridium sediminicola TaxID=3114879 RepID=UPI0031F21758